MVMVGIRELLIMGIQFDIYYQAERNSRDINQRICILHTERCRSYRSYKYIPFAHYPSLRNSCNVYTFMIRSNQNFFKVFPTGVSPTLRYPNKVVSYSAGLRIISDQIYL